MCRATHAWRHHLVDADVLAHVGVGRVRHLRSEEAAFGHVAAEHDAPAGRVVREARACGTVCNTVRREVT